MTDDTKPAEQVDTPQVAAEPASPPAVIPRPKPMLEAQHSGILPILPTNIEEAQRYAQGLIAANQVPDAFKFRNNVLNDPEDIDRGAPPIRHKKGEINAPLVLMGVLKSLELGVAPQTGLGGLLPLNGRFSAWGDLFVGLIQRAGMVKNHTSERIRVAFDPGDPIMDWPDDYGWTVSYWRVGQDDPYTATFTVRDARRAELWGNTNRDPWIKYPDRMLFNRARAWALRDGFADALIGWDLDGIAEEKLDLAPIEVETPRLPAGSWLVDDEEPEEATEPSDGE